MAFVKGKKFKTHAEFKEVYEKYKSKEKISSLKLTSKKLQNYHINKEKKNLLLEGWQKKLEDKETTINCERFSR